MSGNEGYEFVNSNKDMMPCRPMWYDRSVGIIPVFDATKIDGNSLREQMYEYDTPIGQGEPYRYRQRSLRCKYALWTYYDMDNGAYLYMFPGDHGKLGTYSVFKKYTNWQTRKSEDEIPKADSDINFRLIRLADIYLMYAECLIKGGADDNGVAEASKYINRVRKRAGTVLIGRKLMRNFRDKQHTRIHIVLTIIYSKVSIMTYTMKRILRTPIIHAVLKLQKMTLSIQQKK